MKVATGIPGFDKVIGGGFEEGTMNLVSGETGTCKSLLSVQFLVNRAMMFNEDVCYVTTEDGVESLIKQAGQFGWKLKEPPLKDRFMLLKMEPYNVNTIMNYIDKIRSSNAKRIVIDSISVFEMYVREPFTIRKSLFNIIEKLRDGGRVTIMTAEIPEGSKSMSRSEIVEFMADSVIRMQYVQSAQIKRSLTIRKMRFTKHSENVHPFLITSKGIVVK